MSNTHNRLHEAVNEVAEQYFGVKHINIQADAFDVCCNKKQDSLITSKY